MSAALRIPRIALACTGARTSAGSGANTADASPRLLVSSSARVGAVVGVELCPPTPAIDWKLLSASLAALAWVALGAPGEP